MKTIFKKGYYKADCQNGIYFFDKILCDAETEIFKGDLEKAIRTLAENEEITFFYEDSFCYAETKKVLEIYGVNR